MGNEPLDPVMTAISALQTKITGEMTSFQTEIEAIKKTNATLTKENQGLKKQVTDLQAKKGATVDDYLTLKPTASKLGLRTTIPVLAFLAFIVLMGCVMWAVHFWNWQFGVLALVMAVVCVFMLDGGLQVALNMLRVMSDTKLTDEQKQDRIEYLAYQFIGIKGKLANIDEKTLKAEFSNKNIFKRDMTLTAVLVYIGALIAFLIFLNAVHWGDFTDPGFKIILFIGGGAIVLSIKWNKETVVQLVLMVVQILSKPGFTMSQKKGLIRDVLFKYWGIFVDLMGFMGPEVTDKLAPISPDQNVGDLLLRTQQK